MSRWFGIHLASLCVLLAGCASPPVYEGPLTAIVGVTVVHLDGNGERAAVAGSNVIISRDRIYAAGPADTTPGPAGHSVPMSWFDH